MIGLAAAAVLQLLTVSPAAAAPGDDTQPGPAKPVIYLTFDDGPGRDTPAYLDVLQRYDATATFFVTGAAVTANPAVAQRIVGDGHTIANHTWSHPRLDRISNDAIRSELIRTTAAIEATTGRTPVCYRPPYGATNGRVHAQAVAVGLPNAQWITGGGGGSHFGLWDIDTSDWRLSRRGSGWTEARMMAQLNRAGDGDTVLMHDGPSNRGRGLTVLTQWLAANHDRFEFRGLPGCDQGAPPAEPQPVVEPALDPAQPQLWHRARIARLYLAYFDRLPDDGGWEYWNLQYASGASLSEISQQFATSSEFLAAGELTDAEFVEFLYQHVLDRPSDPDGFAYWTQQLASGVKRGQLITYFTDSEEYINRTAEAITGPCFQGDPVEAYRCWSAGLPAYDWSGVVG